MAWLELPHSSTCLVCGRDNPHGLKLSLFVDDATGHVRTSFAFGPEHVGFEGVIHGGAMATVADEAMTWAATWGGRRTCLCGEMTVRYRYPAAVNQPLIVVAAIEFSRPKLIETTAKITDASDNKLVATASAKYVPLTPEQHLEFLRTLIDEPATAAAMAGLRRIS